MESSIQLAYHDPRLAQEFEQTRSNLLWATQGYVTSVAHVGSTSVAGLVGQPVVDCVAMVLDAADLRPAAALIEGLNFRSFPLPSWTDDAGYMLCKPRRGAVTHRVFLTTADGALWSRMIAIRDALRESECERKRFADAKIHWWKRCEGEPVPYEAAKGFFFTHLEEQNSAAAR